MKLFNTVRSRENFKVISMDLKTYIQSTIDKLNADSKKYAENIDNMSANQLTQACYQPTSIGVVDLKKVQDALYADTLTESTTVPISSDSGIDTSTALLTDVMSAIHNDTVARDNILKGLETIKLTDASDPDSLSTKFYQIQSKFVSQDDTASVHWYTNVLSVLQSGVSNIWEKFCLICNFLNEGKDGSEAITSWDDVMSAENMQYGSPTSAMWYSVDWENLNFIQAIGTFYKFNFRIMMSIQDGILNLGGAVLRKGWKWFLKTFVAGEKFQLANGEVSTFTQGGWKMVVSQDRSDLSYDWDELVTYMREHFNNNYRLLMNVPFGELYLTNIAERSVPTPDPEDPDSEYYDFTLYFRPKYVATWYEPYWSSASTGKINNVTTIPNNSNTNVFLSSLFNGQISLRDQYSLLDKSIPDGFDVADVDNAIDIAQRMKFSIVFFLKFLAGFGQRGENWDVESSYFTSGDWVYQCGVDVTSAFGYSDSLDDVVSGTLNISGYMEQAVIKLLQYVHSHDDDCFDMSYEWVTSPKVGSLIPATDTTLRQDFMTGMKTIGVIALAVVATVVAIKSFKKLSLALRTAQVQADRFAFDDSIPITDANMKILGRMQLRVTLLSTLMNGVKGAAVILPSSLTGVVKKIATRTDDDSTTLSSIKHLIAGE